MTDNSTVAQLKNDIDSGRTGDKVSTADPGLSPLGTDDEAAGRPASPEVIDTARRREAAIGKLAVEGEAPATASKYGPIVLMLAVVVVVGAVVVAFVLLR